MATHSNNVLKVNTVIITAAIMKISNCLIPYLTTCSLRFKKYLQNHYLIIFLATFAHRTTLLITNLDSKSVLKEKKKKSFGKRSANSRDIR